MKHFIWALFLSVQVAFAQEVKVEKVTQLTEPKDGEFTTPLFTAVSDEIAFSLSGFKGLYLMKLNSKKITKITDSDGAGYEPVFTDDGSRIIYRTNEFAENKKYSTIKEYDLKTSTTKVLVEKSRNVSTPQVFDNQVIYSLNGNRNKKTLLGITAKKTSQEIYVMLENLQIVLFNGDSRKVLSPNGNGNYIWASLSPDKTKLLYNFNGRSTYICDLNGKNVKELGKINAPKWLNNNIIVGMNDKDNGQVVVSSEIVAYSLSTEKMINLTSTQDRNEMYPSPSANGKQIVFQTDKGVIFLMNLTLK